MKKLSIFFLILNIGIGITIAQNPRSNKQYLRKSGTGLVFHLDSMIAYHWDATDKEWHNYYFFSYTFDNAGNRTNNLTQHWDKEENDWIYYNQVFYTFDIDNNMTELVDQYWEKDKDDWLNSSKSTITNNNAGNITQKVYQRWDQGNRKWKNENRDTYTYNTKEQMLTWSKEIWDEVSADWVNYTMNSLTYVQDLLKRELHTIWDKDTKWQNDRRINYIHDTLGNLTVETWETWDRNVNRWKYYSRQILKYDEFSNEIEHISQTWNNRWVNRLRIELKYLDNDLPYEIIDQTWNSSKASWENLLDIIWEYDENENLLDEYIYIWDDGNSKWNYSSWYHMYYSEHNGAAMYESEFDKIKIYPNPFSSTVNIEYSLKKPQFHGISIYDIRGKEIFFKNEFKDQGNHTSTWDATGYPEGMYFLKLVSSEKITVKKLMKKK